MPVFTSSLNIRVTTATDYKTDNTKALQALLQQATHIIIDTVINLSDQVKTSFEGQVIEGTETGEIRPIGEKMKTHSMIVLKHPNCKILNLHSTNPLLLQSNLASNKGGGRQGTIDIQADFCLIQGCTMVNQVNAVIAGSNYRAHGSRILENNFFDCLGVGLEDRGDAVSIWGSGTVIDGNYASCKEGTDGRLAFHAEAPVTNNDGRPEFDAQHTIMTNNLAWGPFRRHFAFEGITNGVSIGNISIGGATWWGEAYIMCSNVLVENTIKYTRTADIKNGEEQWHPIRGAICIQNWSKHVNIRSMVLMDEKSAGAGVVLTRSSTVQGDHKLTLQVSMQNRGLETNTAFDLVPAEDLHLNNCYAEGFGMQIRSGAAEHNNLLLTSCRFVGNGTATGILFNKPSGTLGGNLSINNCIIDVGANNIAIHLIELANVHIANSGLRAAKLAVDLQDIKEKFVLNDCYNMNTDVLLGLRYSAREGTSSPVAREAGDVPNIAWLVNDNVGINSGFIYSQAQLAARDGAINTTGKVTGKMVLGYDANKQLRYYYATGSSATAPWAALETTGSVTPA